MILSNHRVFELKELSTANLVHCLDTEIVLPIGDQVLHGPADFVFAGHDIRIGSPACLSALQNIVNNGAASIIAWRIPGYLAGVLSDGTGNNVLAWRRKTFSERNQHK